MRIVEGVKLAELVDDWEYLVSMKPCSLKNVLN